MCIVWITTMTAKKLEIKRREANEVENQSIQHLAFIRVRTAGTSSPYLF